MTRARGWIVHYLLLIGMIVALLINAPVWLLNTFISLAFLSGLALGCLEIRRRWRDQ